MVDKKTTREPSVYEFWNNVKKMLKEKGLTFSYLAEKTGIKYQTIMTSKWAQKQKSQNDQNRTLRSKMVMQIAKALDTTPDTLLFGESTLDRKNKEKKNQELEALANLPLAEVLRESEQILTQCQMKNVLEHALSFFNITIDSLETEALEAPDHASN